MIIRVPNIPEEVSHDLINGLFLPLPEYIESLYKHKVTLGLGEDWEISNDEAEKMQYEMRDKLFDIYNETIERIKAGKNSDDDV